MDQQRAQQQAQRPRDGVNVDFIPKKSPQKMKKDIEGGEYVDYEEVKDWPSLFLLDSFTPVQLDTSRRLGADQKILPTIFQT